MVDLPHGRLPQILQPLIFGIEPIDGRLLGLRVCQGVAERCQLLLRMLTEHTTHIRSVLHALVRGLPHDAYNH